MLGAPAMAAVSAADAAKLGAELTPLGAEKAGNADGSIPAWDGGLTSAAQAGFANFRPGQHHPDPYASDKPLYTITAANMGQYANRLTEGHKKLLQTYRNTFKMNVYPTHRSAASPQRIYDATKRIATTAELAAGGNGVVKAGEGIPFPIPKSGVEVFWNHVLRYRGDIIVRTIGQAPVTAGGSYTMVKFRDETMVAYSLAGAKSENLNNTIAYFIQETLAPARLAGEVLLVQETLDQSVENRRAWVYNPGQRRVRRAPNVAFDNPGTNSDDAAHLRPVRHVQRQPAALRLDAGGQERNAGAVQQLQAATRTRSSTPTSSRRTTSTRTWRATSCTASGWWIPSSSPARATSTAAARLYVDEDSWQILAVDCYDSRGQLYRVQEGHVINYYEVPALWTALETGLRPEQRPLPRAGPGQRGAAQPRLLAEAHRGRLPAGGAAAPRRSLITSPFTDGQVASDLPV